MHTRTHSVSLVATSGGEVFGYLVVDSGAAVAQEVERVGW